MSVEPPETRPGRNRRDRRYWFRVMRLALVAVITTVIALPMSIGGFVMWGLTHAPCVRGNAGYSPTSYNLAYRDIDIPTRSGGVYHGYFIPGTNGATVIVPPPLSSDRTGMLSEAAIVARHGYNVILYDSRMCSGKGSTSMGYLEADDIGDVLTYLRQNTDQVDPARIAVHGFSSAGAASIMAAARYPAIRAVVAEGGYHDMNEQMGMKNPHTVMEWLLLFGAQITYHAATGLDPAVLSPISAIGKIPPRSIFLIYGSREVSLEGAREELAAARGAYPKADARLWVVPGSGHGGYLGAAASDYARNVMAFYDCALLTQCERWYMLRAGL